ncbi:thiamine-phosphate kinase [Magnetospirillum sp. 64-120]|uniref:thiamine-phosphate kinase n=1 Tax=Magnetospirillum sp. 64-120 TaxID=1895778 RepID=UPI000925EC5D|nr:thiamine-phosphate kinase [Magnetospirillum sp. 64-120]OJX81027.1 MAG: thiamine-phosphate kinase [Magnetospirillum sp. 64-120]
MSGAPSDDRDEFALIARLFAPLAQSYPGALGLGDDAALMDVPAGQQLVLTMDSMVAGVHFFADDPADLIARKLIRVNVSDLAAKGAHPFAIMLSAAFPHAVGMDWLRRFADGLGQDCRDYGLALIGGDTVSTPGPLTLTLTAFGRVGQGQAILRSGAKDGDVVFMTGTLGDAALGLLSRQGRFDRLPPSLRDHLDQRYLLPQPRHVLGPRLAGLAHAAMDVSDGLVQDLGHLCRQSGLGAVIRAQDLPLSDAARHLLADDPGLLSNLLSGGDDYEIVFTVPPEHADKIARLADDAGTSVAAIGRMCSQAGVVVQDGQGRPLDLALTGWRHFNDTRGK